MGSGRTPAPAPGAAYRRRGRAAIEGHYGRRADRVARTVARPVVGPPRPPWPRGAGCGPTGPTCPTDPGAAGARPFTGESSAFHGPVVGLSHWKRARGCAVSCTENAVTCSTSTEVVELLIGQGDDVVLVHRAAPTTARYFALTLMGRMANCPALPRSPLRANPDGGRCVEQMSSHTGSTRAPRIVQASAR